MWTLGSGFENLKKKSTTEHYNEMLCRPTMGIVDRVASSNGGINLTEIKNKGLTDGNAYVNTIGNKQGRQRISENSAKVFRINKLKMN